MSFCSNCGTKYGDGDKFCPGCGYNLTTGEPAPATGSTRQSNKVMTAITDGFMYYKGLIIHSTTSTEELFEDNKKSISFVITLFSMIINSVLYAIVIKKAYNFTKTFLLGGYGYGDVDSMLLKINFFTQFLQGMLFSLVLIMLLSLGLFIIVKVYNGETINIIRVIAVASVPLTCINLIAFIVSYISFSVALIVISIGVYAAIGTIFTNSYRYITSGRDAHIAIAVVVMLSNIGFCFTILKVYSNLFLQYSNYLGSFF